MNGIPSFNLARMAIDPSNVQRVQGTVPNR
jgi:hypothetical protein